ncbi:hypothetical protein C8J57DRAFT_1251963 [Mycena rebaudengoi]|nr:hypothetical protein C8J57DRAFT_1251963 [Mycena rebaudengoi]
MVERISHLEHILKELTPTLPVPNSLFFHSQNQDGFLAASTSSISLINSYPEPKTQFSMMRGKISVTFTPARIQPSARGWMARTVSSRTLSRMCSIASNILPSNAACSARRFYAAPACRDGARSFSVVELGLPLRVLTRTSFPLFLPSRSDSAVMSRICRCAPRVTKFIIARYGYVLLFQHKSKGKGTIQNNQNECEPTGAKADRPQMGRYCG